MTTAADHSRATDEARYALGLSMLRSGAPARALLEWEHLSPESHVRLRPTLERLYCHVVASLLAGGKPAEAAQYAEFGRLRGHTLPDEITRRLAAALILHGLFVWAWWAVGRLPDARSGVDRLLRAIVGSSDKRGEELAVLVDDSSLRDSVRNALARCAAAALALGGRHAEGLKVLSSRPIDDPLSGALAALLRFAASGGRERPSGDRCDWIALAKLTRDTPELHSRLVSRPSTSSDLARASYYIERARHAEAREPLRSALVASPWEPGVARNFAVLAHVRASRRLPEIDVEAWRDFIAVMGCFLENPLWSAAWVQQRRKIYGTDENEQRLAEDLRADLAELVARKLTDAAATPGAGEGVACVATLRAELAKERRAAAAMWRVGKIRAPDGARLAFGPLFAERAGLHGMLQSYFMANPEPHGPPASEELRRLLLATGRDEAAIRRMMAEGDERPEAELRRWFSELGDALALHASGDAVGAREAALRVYVDYAALDAVDPKRFRERNPGYALFDDGVARLRTDAGAVVCDMSLVLFRTDLAKTDVDVARVPKQIRGLLGEAVAFHRSDEVRYALTRMLLQKRVELQDARNISSARTACELMKGVAGTGLTGMEKPAGQSFIRLGSLLSDQERYKEAVAAYEESWQIWKEPSVAVSLVHGRLEHFERLRSDGRKTEAETAIRRAREVAEEARAAFPEDQNATFLEGAVEGVLRGAAASSYFTRNRPEQREEAVPPPLPAAASAAIASLDRQLRKEDAAAGWREAESALAAAPRHPDVVVPAVRAALRFAVAVAPETGASVFRKVESAVAVVAGIYPEHRKVQEAACAIARHRVLFYEEGEVGRLHAKAVRLWLAGRDDEAIDVLKVVFALSHKRDPEVCALLSECLVMRARSSSNPSGDLATAERILAVGRETAPRHPGMERVRASLRELRSARDGRTGGGQ